MKLIRTKDDLGNEIYLNLETFYVIQKSKSCEGRPTINFLGNERQWIQSFSNIQERDELFNNIGTLS